MRGCSGLRVYRSEGVPVRGCTGQRVYRSEGVPVRGCTGQRVYLSEGVPVRGCTGQRTAIGMLGTVRASGTECWRRRVRQVRVTCRFGVRVFLLGSLIFKGLTARRLSKSFGVKGLMTVPGTRLTNTGRVKKGWRYLPLKDTLCCRCVLLPG
jgi:hypothetical protein